MVEIDLEGKTKTSSKAPQVLIERNLTTGKVVDVSQWYDEANDKEKVILTIKIGEIALSCWMNADIKKGSDPAYSTLSYINLENLKLLTEFKAVQKNIKTLDDMAQFWRQSTLNKEIKFVPETITSKTDGQKYSVIKTIEGFA